MRVKCSVYSTTEWPVNEERIYYIQAPAKYYGNRLASYGSNLTFSLRSRVGTEVALAGTQPVIIESSGELFMCYSGLQRQEPNCKGYGV